MSNWYVKDGLPVWWANAIGVTNYCCFDCIPVGIDCVCDRTSDYVDTVYEFGSDDYWELFDLQQDWLLTNAYDFTYDQPTMLIAQIDDGTQNADFITQCQCPDMVDNECGLVCDDTGHLVSAFGDCTQDSICHFCESDGSLPLDPGGAVHGDPCTYLGADGSGSRPGFCIKVGDPLPMVPNNSERECCKIGGLWEMTGSPSTTLSVTGGDNCHFEMRTNAKCSRPFDPPIIEGGGAGSGLPFCESEIYDTLIYAWVDRGWMKLPFSPFSFFWYFMIRVWVNDNDSGHTINSHAREWLYRSQNALIPDTNGCVMTRGTHVMQLIAQTHGPDDPDIEWCIFPNTMLLTAV